MTPLTAVESALYGLSPADRRHVLILALRAGACSLCAVRIYPSSTRARSPVLCRACRKGRDRVRRREAEVARNARRKGERLQALDDSVTRDEARRSEPVFAVVRTVRVSAAGVEPGEDTPLMAWGRMG